MPTDRPRELWWRAVTTVDCRTMRCAPARSATGRRRDAAAGVTDTAAIAPPSMMALIRKATRSSCTGC